MQLANLSVANPCASSVRLGAARLAAANAALRYAIAPTMPASASTPTITSTARRLVTLRRML